MDAMSLSHGEITHVSDTALMVAACRALEPAPLFLGAVITGRIWMRLSPPPRNKTEIGFGEQYGNIPEPKPAQTDPNQPK